MADFLPAFETMIVAEGGYRLHTIDGDRGGMTYAGISRVHNPNWSGWEQLDHGSTPSPDLVRAWYKGAYWAPICGDDISSQAVAQNIFDFYVNAGAPAKKLAQLVVGVTPDGAFGPKTVVAINSCDPDKFVLIYTLAKIARYRDIVTRDRSQSKFLLGWVNRALKGVNV